MDTVKFYIRSMGMLLRSHLQYPASFVMQTLAANRNAAPHIVNIANNVLKVGLPFSKIKHEMPTNPMITATIFLVVSSSLLMNFASTQVNSAFALNTTAEDEAFSNISMPRWNKYNAPNMPRNPFNRKMLMSLPVSNFKKLKSLPVSNLLFFIYPSRPINESNKPVTKKRANTMGRGDTVAWEAMTLPDISTVLNKAIPTNSDNVQKKDLFIQLSLINVPPRTL